MIEQAVTLIWGTYYVRYTLTKYGGPPLRVGPSGSTKLIDQGRKFKMAVHSSMCAHSKALCKKKTVS